MSYKLPDNLVLKVRDKVRSIASQYLPLMAHYYSRKYNSIPPSIVGTTDSPAWGYVSGNITNPKIYYNPISIGLPQRLQDYVIKHEISHIPDNDRFGRNRWHETNWHMPRFYRRLYKMHPQYAIDDAMLADPPSYGHLFEKDPNFKLPGYHKRPKVSRVWGPSMETAGMPYFMGNRISDPKGFLETDFPIIDPKYNPFISEQVLSRNQLKEIDEIDRLIRISEEIGDDIGLLALRQDRGEIYNPSISLDRFRYHENRGFKIPAMPKRLFTPVAGSIAFLAGAAANAENATARRAGRKLLELNEKYNPEEVWWNYWDRWSRSPVGEGVTDTLANVLHSRPLRRQTAAVNRLLDAAGKATEWTVNKGSRAIDWMFPSKDNTIQ